MTDPFTQPAKGLPYWLREALPSELNLHKKLTDQLTKLETQNALNQPTRRPLQRYPERDVASSPGKSEGTPQAQAIDLCKSLELAGRPNNSPCPQCGRPTWPVRGILPLEESDGRRLLPAQPGAIAISEERVQGDWWLHPKNSAPISPEESEEEVRQIISRFNELLDQFLEPLDE